MNPRERFHACMNYQPVDRVPNHEVGVWVQTKHRWQQEGLNTDDRYWDWFVGDPHWDLDPREYIDLNTEMIPGYEEKVISREGDTETIQRSNGVISKALVTGTAEGMRMSMDEYISFPVEPPPISPHSSTATERNPMCVTRPIGRRCCYPVGVRGSTH